MRSRIVPNLLFTLSLAILLATAACKPNGPGPGPGPGPDPCVENPDDCVPPPPGITLEGMDLLQVVELDQSVSGKFVSDGDTYALARASGTENIVFFDGDGDQIDSVSIPNLISVNAVFIGNDGNYVVSATGTAANNPNQIVGTIAKVSSVEENAELASAPPFFFAAGARTPSNARFMVRGEVAQTSAPDGQTINISRIFVAQVNADLSLGELRLVRELPEEELSIQDLKIAANGTKLLIAENSLTTLAPSTIFLYDIVTGETTDLEAPIEGNESRIAELLSRDDEFLVVMSSGSASSQRRVRALSTDGEFATNSLLTVAGRNLVPVQGGYLSAITRDNANLDGFDVVLQHVSGADGGIIAERVIPGQPVLGNAPFVTVLDNDHLAIFWTGSEADEFGVFVEKTYLAFEGR